MSANRERRSDGTYAEEYDEGDVLDAIRELGPRASSRDVSEKSGVPRRTTMNILHELERGGEIECEEIGDSYAWTVVAEA